MRLLALMVNEPGENAHGVKKLMIAALEALVHAIASEIVQRTSCDRGWHGGEIVRDAGITWLRGAAVADRKRLQNVSAGGGGGRSSGIRRTWRKG